MKSYEEWKEQPISEDASNSIAELDGILMQNLVPLKQFVHEHPDLLRLVSSRLQRIWMDIKQDV